MRIGSSLEFDFLNEKLNGKVRTTTIYVESLNGGIKKEAICYFNKSGDITEINYCNWGEDSYRRIFLYSRNNRRNRIFDIMYNDEGAFFGGCISIFNSKGQIIEEKLLEEEGDVDSTYTYEYKYDETGRLIELSRYSGLSKNIILQTFVYDEKGNQFIKFNNGYITNNPLKIYDCNGNLIEEFLHDIYGDNFMHIKIKYDALNRPVEIFRNNNRGHKEYLKTDYIVLDEMNNWIKIEESVKKTIHDLKEGGQKIHDETKTKIFYREIDYYE